jgi:drug/metabolite transporter (DMT)-like permease
MPVSGNLRSIVSMVIAVGLFSMMDAVMKTLTATYPATQVAAMRGLSAMPLVCLYVLWRREAHALLRIRWPLHLFRGVIGVLMLSLFAFAIKELALAEAYTIFFIAPLLITVLSIPVLKETVRPVHWIAIGVGLVGVVIAMRPSGEDFFSLGALAVLAAATCYAVSAVSARVLSRTDSSVNQVFWTTLLMGVGAGTLAAPEWVSIADADWPLIAALAVTGFLGLLAITDAFRHGQASAVAPFEYTALAWGVGLDWILWHAVPDHYTLIGGGIIIASGLYLIRNERVKDVAVPP